MKAKDVTVFICDHCNKKLFRKHAMVNHELICDKNPINKKACYGCIHLTTEQVERYSYYGDDENVYTSGCFKCIKFDKLMYSWNAEKRGLPELYPDDFDGQKKMPNECRYFTEHDQEKYNGSPLDYLPF